MKTKSSLVLVESPSKAKTIGKYLGKSYKVMATVGHLIDLPKNKLGVDTENEYKPEFITIKGKAAIISKIKKELKENSNILLAMDPDREGEAIAWHVAQALKLKNAKRIVFHEITKNAVNAAIENPREIDENLVQAQIARRVLDRLVGYKVSELLWKKIWYGLSAGRVQSVALRLIVEREREIEAFIPKEFWKFAVKFTDAKKNQLEAKLVRKNDKKYIPENEAEVKSIEKELKDADLEVKDVRMRDIKKHAYPPFTTSTLQQAGNNILGFPAKRTMGLAQVLYQAGFITYMRTDSVYLSQVAIDAIREKIGREHGEKYLPEKPNYYKNRSKNAQEAHEAIRPSDFGVSSDQIAKELGSAEAKLYKLIMNRAVASQMSERLSQIITVELHSQGESGDIYQFTLGGEKVLFDGFRKVLKSDSTADDEQLQKIEELKVGERYPIDEFVTEQQFTKPKPRYTDASLVKALELHGVGRPSTYATIISTVQERGYVEKRARNLHPLDVGKVVNDFLYKHFNRLVDYEYTADVEDGLDKISEGKVEYVPFIEKEYKPLVKELKETEKNVEKEDVVILGDSDEKCELCSSKMVIRLSRYGKFLSCSRFPECKGMKDLGGGEESLDPEVYEKVEKCPKCASGMKLKNSKYGKFWACERYPECKGTVPLLLKEKCPQCGKSLVERKGRWGKNFIGCSGYPDCRYIKKTKKKSEEE